MSLERDLLNTELEDLKKKLTQAYKDGADGKTRRELHRRIRHAENAILIDSTVDESMSPKED